MSDKLELDRKIWSPEKARSNLAILYEQRYGEKRNDRVFVVDSPFEAELAKLAGIPYECAWMKMHC